MQVVKISILVVLFTLVVTTLFVGVPSVIIFFSSALEALQIYIAPKAWLLEYASDLVK